MRVLFQLNSFQANNDFLPQLYTSLFCPYPIKTWNHQSILDNQ